MHGSHHSACSKCIHEQSECERPHQVLASQWPRSGIGDESQHRHWEELKTSKGGQYSTQQSVGHATWFSNDNWESKYFKILWSPQTDSHIAENACCIDCADTWLSKRVQWQSKSHSMNRSTTNYVYEDRVEFHTEVAGADAPFTTIHRRVARESRIPWLPASLHHTGWMDHW